MKLVCTDLDRTLLPNGEQVESAHARPILWHLLRTHEVALAYVSGRDLERVLSAIEEYGLPTPDAIVADVGTSIYLPVSGEWVKSAEWDARVSRDWGGASSVDIRKHLKEFDYLQDQAEDRQSEYKRSFYYPQSADEKMLRESIGSVLSRHSVKAALVFSHDPEKAVGLLDVLPRSATKRQAVTFLQSLFNLEKDQVMFAGDSGNDVTAICDENPGVLVANADTDTRESVSSRIADANLPSCVYFAVGHVSVAGQDVLNGNYAAGIVEGLVHFRPHWGAHLHDSQWLAQALDKSPG